MQAIAPELSIILVNWNCLAFTEQCIASICATAKDVAYEVIVVDNCSADAPCRSLADQFPWVTLLLSESNLGFGRANNLGVRSSSGRYLLFLNPDTLVRGDALREMMSSLEANPAAGAIGCRLLNPDGSIQTSSVQRFPTILNQLLALDWLKRRFPNLSLWGLQPLYTADRTTAHEVDVVSGACLMVRREVFEAAGGFNPEYFMYAEEVDLCHAIRREGWKVLHLGGAEVVHFGGQSTKSREDGFAAVAMRDSVYRFLRRTRGSLYALLYRAGLLWSALCRLALLLIAAPMMAILQRSEGHRDSIRAYRKWLRIARWTVGLEYSDESVLG
jgi:GT2 family glycosyltransferase